MTTNTTTTENIAPTGQYGYNMTEVTAAKSTLRDYVIACKSFANDTRDWFAIGNRGLLYTTDGGQGWKESCDNAHGGIDISWAFHTSDEDIAADAPAFLIAATRNAGHTATV